MKRQSHNFLFFVFLSFGLCGCFSPVKYSGDIETPGIGMTYGDIALSGEVRNRWWEAFNDESLNDFVEIVLNDSPTLQIAYLKLLDSELAIKQSKAGYYPSVSFSMGVGGGGNIYSDPTADPSYNLGLSLNYEVDLWGRVRAQTRVAELSRDSARDDAELAALSLVANVATHWFTIQYYNDRKILTEQLLALSEDYYDLVESYYMSGQSTGMDVLESRQQIETLRSTLNEIDANIRIARHALSILAGGTHVPQATGSLPEAIDVGGVPSVEELLASRPEVRAALRAAQAADAKIVIALANRLPSLRLSADLSYRNKSIVDLFKTLMWNLGASFAATLFDGFDKTTALDRAKVAYLSQVLTYATTVQNAVADVEKALLNMQVAERQLADARAQVERQNEILNVSREYFIGGSLAFDRVLSALRSTVSSAQAELNARHTLINAQITLYRTMDGVQWAHHLHKTGLEKAKTQLENLGKDKEKDKSQDKSPPENNDAEEKA